MLIVLNCHLISEKNVGWSSGLDSPLKTTNCLLGKLPWTNKQGPYILTCKGYEALGSGELAGLKLPMEGNRSALRLTTDMLSGVHDNLSSLSATNRLLPSPTRVDLTDAAFACMDLARKTSAFVAGY